MLTFQFTPFPEIRTPRLLLRPIMERDAPLLFEMRRDVDVMRYIERPRPQVMDEVLTLIADMKAMAEKGEGISWGITVPPSDDLIGTIGYYRAKPEHHRAEVGYMLSPGHWKKGIMTEALEAVVEFGFHQMKLHSIEADINPDNQASEALLIKTGFVKEAHFRENFYWHGKFLDSAIYSRITPLNDQPST